MTMREGLAALPVIREMQREQKRNALIRDIRRYDICQEDDVATSRMKAHVRRRMEKNTKTRWVRLASQCAKEIRFGSKEKQKTMKRYLEEARNACETSLLMENLKYIK